MNCLDQPLSTSQVLYAIFMLVVIGGLGFLAGWRQCSAVLSKRLEREWWAKGAEYERERRKG